MQIIFDDVISRVKTAMKGDSVYAFAKKLGTSQQPADCYINGKRKPSLDFLYRVCIVCNCSADWLLGLNSSPPTDASPDRSAELKREIEAILKRY